MDPKRRQSRPLDFDDNAAVFSRAPIPWGPATGTRQGPRAASEAPSGCTSFRRAALLDFPTLPLGDLERIEQLEQLRWMENGYKIRVAVNGARFRQRRRFPRMSLASSNCLRKSNVQRDNSQFSFCAWLRKKRLEPPVHHFPEARRAGEATSAFL